MKFLIKLGIVLIVIAWLASYVVHHMIAQAAHAQAAQVEQVQVAQL